MHHKGFLQAINVWPLVHAGSVDTERKTEERKKIQSKSCRYCRGKLNAHLPREHDHRRGPANRDGKNPDLQVSNPKQVARERESDQDEVSW